MLRLGRCGLLFGIALSLNFSLGCSFFKSDPLTVAKDLSSQGRKKEAIGYLLKKIGTEANSDRSILLAEYGAQLAHTEVRDYHSAAKFYQYISNFSATQAKQLSALKYLGSIYFDHFKDFELAIGIYENLLRSAQSIEEKAKFRLLLAKSHYYLAQIDQAEAELNAYKALKISESARYEGDVFESNLLVSKKMHEEASKILMRLIEKYPERAKSDGLELNLVACYEDMKDFDAAIDAMNRMLKNYPDREFLEMRISRLKERKNNMPGAKGLKK